MNKKVNRILLFLLAAILVFSVAACGSVKQSGVLTEGTTGSTHDTKDETKDTADTTETEIDSSDAVSDVETPDDEIHQQSDTVSTGPERIGIYTIDEMTLETVSITAMIDTTGGLTTDAVVDAVVLVLEDHSLEVFINDTIVTENVVTVDIEAEDPVMPFGNSGSSVESVILDCISYSLFDNFDEIKAICFTVNGSEYESGHIHLPMGEPYLKRE